MTVTINELGMAQYFNSTTGPWGRWLGRRTDNVYELARANAQGGIIGMQSHELIEGLRQGLVGTPAGAFSWVGTSASHREDVAKLGMTYPAYHDTHNYPWLFTALRDEFPRQARRIGSSA